MKKILLFISTLIMFLSFNIKANAAVYEKIDVGMSTFKYNWCQTNTGVSSDKVTLNCSYQLQTVGTFDSWTSNSTYDMNPRVFAGFYLQTQGIDSERFYNGEEYVLIMKMKLTGVPINTDDFKFALSGGSSYTFNANNVNVTSSSFVKYDNNFYEITINFIPTETFQYLTINTNNSVDPNQVYTIPNEILSSLYVLSDVSLSIGIEDYNITRYISDDKVIIDQNTETNEQLGNLNDNLTNDNVSGATSSAGNFFSGFETDTFGLTSIITAPLTLIQSITNSSCSSLGLPLPYVNKSIHLPCLSSIYQQYFGPFLTLYQTITFGIVAYWVCVRIFALVKDFKNPDHDEVEVLDL